MFRHGVPMFVVLLALAACAKAPVADKACTPPRDYWQKPHFIRGLDPLSLQVTIDHQNQIYLSGKPISQTELKKQLTHVASIDNPVVDVFLETEMGADCEVLKTVRDLIDQSMNCRQSGQCAEGSRTVWNEWPPPPGSPAS